MLIPRRIIPAVAACADSESTRFALGSVYLERDPETGDPVAVAIDGKRLLAATWAEPEIDKEKYPAYPGIDPSPKKNFSFLFPADRDTLKRLRSLPAPGKGAGCDHVNYLQLTEESAAPNQTTVAASATKSPAMNPEKFGTFSTRAVEGRFPRWREVIPRYTLEESTTIELDATLLAEMLEAAAEIAGNSEFRAIRVTVPHDHEKPAVISVDRAGIKLVGVQMPVCVDRRKAKNGEDAAPLAAAWLAAPLPAPASAEMSPEELVDAVAPPAVESPADASPAESIDPPAAPEVVEPVAPVAPVAPAEPAPVVADSVAEPTDEPADISAAWGAEPVDMPAEEVARVAAHAAPPVSGPQILAEMPGDDDKIRCFIAGRNAAASQLYRDERTQGAGLRTRLPRMIRLREDLAKYDRLIADRRAELAAATAPIAAEAAAPLAPAAAPAPKSPRRRSTAKAAAPAPVSAPVREPHAFNAARRTPLDSSTAPAAAIDSHPSRPVAPLPVDDADTWGVVPADITSARPAESTPAIHKPTNALEALTCFGAVVTGF